MEFKVILWLRFSLELFQVPGEDVLHALHDVCSEDLSKTLKLKTFHSVNNLIHFNLTFNSL